MKFRAAFTWGKVLGRTFRGHGRAALVAESNMQAKWARLERCAVPVLVLISILSTSTSIGILTGNGTSATSLAAALPVTQPVLGALTKCRALVLHHLHHPL